jgi:hypothetical protein
VRGCCDRAASGDADPRLHVNAWNTDHGSGSIQRPRWVEVAAGLILGAITSLCLVGLATLPFVGRQTAPVLAIIVTVVGGVYAGGRSTSAYV